MMNWIMQLAMDSNGRPFTDEEVERLVNSVETLPDRLAAVQAVEQSQKWLTRLMTDHLAPIAQEYGLPKDPLAHDFVAGLTTLCNAALCDDHELILANVVKPYQRMAYALDVPQSVFSGMFAAAKAGLVNRLGADAISPLSNYFDTVIYALQADDALPMQHTEISEPNQVYQEVTAC